MGKIKFGKGGLQAELKMPEPQQAESVYKPKVGLPAEQPIFQDFTEMIPALLDLMPPAPTEIDLSPIQSRIDALEARLAKVEDHHGMATEYISRLEARIDKNVVDMTQKIGDNGNKTIIHHKDHNADIGELQRTVKKLSNELERTKSTNRVLTALTFLAIGASIAIQFI